VGTEAAPPDEQHGDWELWTSGPTRMSTYRMLERQLALELNFIPVVPPKSSRVDPWEYDRAMYKRRNEIERLFRRLKWP
jgi:hypothetical protein